MTRVLMRDKETTQTHRTKLCGNKARHWGFEVTAKECLSHQKLEEGGDSPLQPLEGMWPSQHLSFGPLASRIMRQEISV